MNRSTPIALLFAIGCADAASEPDLLLPDELPVEWDEAWNGDEDGLGALVPVDVMVYEGSTGEPVVGVEVLVSANDAGVVPVPVEGVLVVDDEADPDADPSGGLGHAFWDASRDQYVAFDAELVPALADLDSGSGGGGLLDELLLQTDDGGVARLYLYVDSFPFASPDEEAFAELSIVVSMGDTDETFRLVPR